MSAAASAAAHSISSSQPKTQQKSVPGNTKPKIQPTAAGTAVRKPEEHKKSAAVHVADIDMSMEDDTRDPWLTDSVVLPGDKLIIVDNYNDKLKLINLQSNEIVDHLKYVNAIWGITAVTNTQVAVTCPDDKTILFINVTHKLTLDHKVKVKGKCYGIANISDKFVITYCEPAKVEIISQKGKLLQTVVTKDRGRQLFHNSCYVTVSPDQQTLYISDYERGTVTSLDLSGQVKATYKDEELEGPCGLIVDKAGVLYVCGRGSDNIHQLTPDLHKIQILLQIADGIMGPQSVSYNEEQNKLYIGYETVKVYQLQ